MRRFSSPAATTLLYLLGCLLAFGSVASFYSWLALSPSYSYSAPSPHVPRGCRPDGEGSWSIGIFFGDSPFNLKPVESAGLWSNASSAWPVANPVVTCATASDAGFPSNFVADPFLYVQGDTFYLFFETKNSVTLQGDIGVAKSNDQGATWQHLGTVLDEDWHLSYPYVFKHDNQIYMMPEGSRKGDLRLYRAVDFPLKWTLEKVILEKPLVDSFIIKYENLYWLFGSDFSHLGAVKNGELEIWYGTSPLGPWKPHKQNPVHNIDKSYGARNAGRPFLYKGKLYRTGQDCGETYGRRIRVFRIEALTIDTYREVEVFSGQRESKKGRNAWNGARYHHLDAQEVSPAKWVAVMDGDRVPSGDSTRRLAKGYIAIAALTMLILLVGLLLGIVKCVLLISRCLPISEKRSDSLPPSGHHIQIYSKIRWLLARANRISSSIQGKINFNSCSGRSALFLAFIFAIALACTAVHYLNGGNGAEEAYPLKGRYSQFTLLTMTYDARIWNLKMFVKHYSRCSSVAEIVVVWNKGEPPRLDELDSAVPVRLRLEKQNSLNNRFKHDTKIQTRAVLELDDDIMMTCDDVERGFKVWRQHPERLVGFYPRLADGNPLQYRNERYARGKNGYNMILTGAAFMDKELAFGRYWSNEAEKGREIVQKLFNCEDVLLNFLYANASSSRTVDYVRPTWAIDTSKFSGVAISKNTQAHYNIRSECMNRFAKMFGTVANRKWEFNSRGDGWDV